MTKIQWTDATWNPTRGCSRVNYECDNCYAMRTAHRFNGPGQPYEGLTTLRNGRVDWAGSVRFVADKLADPLTWRKPRMVFVDSMSDLFHPSLENEEIAAVFGVMAACPQHVFQVLTKRPRRMRHWFEWMKSIGRCGTSADPDDPFWIGVEASYHACKATGLELPLDTPSCTWPIPNVWLGVSAGTQKSLEEFVPELEATPAAVRFVSAEPLLEPVGLGSRHIDWLIIGGESGHGARPCKTEWIRRLLWECRAFKIAAFVKQLGSNTDVPTRDSKGGDPSEWPEDLRVRQMPAGVMT